MRIFNNKKGSEELIENIPYLILTMIVVLALYFLLSYFSNPKIDTTTTQANIFIYRTLYSPNSISYTDPKTGRVYPGIIYDQNFTSEVLDASMAYSYEKQVSAKLQIYPAEYTAGLEPIKEAYYNKVWFERLEPVARAGMGGAGGAKYFKKEIPIIYQSGEERTPATLVIAVVVPIE
jgi:hypothetical protein